MEDYLCLYFIIIFLAVGSLIVCLVFNCLLFKYKPYEEYKDLISNWKRSPIKSIEYNYHYLNNINSESLQNYDDNIFSDMFNLEYLDKSYDYKYMSKNREGDKKFHICGLDSGNNPLYLPKEIECPINDIEVSGSIFPSKNILDKTIRINDKLYVHYTNKNIYGHILNNLKAVFSKYIYNDYVSNLGYFTISLLGEKYTINILYYKYKALSGDSSSDFLFQNLDEIYFKLHSKSIIISINVISLIIYLFLIIFTILFVAKEILSGFQFINIFLALVVFILRFIFFLPLGNDAYLNIYNNRDDKGLSIEYNIILIGCTGGYLLFFSILSAVKTSNNIYYYLVYIIRYGFICEIFEGCKKRRKEKNEKEIEELDEEIRKLNNELYEYKKEKKEIILENQKTLKLIKKMKEELEEKKRSVLNNNNNIYSEEEIEIQNEIKNLEEAKKNEIEIYNNLLLQINEIEKEINYYKMKELME